MFGYAVANREKLTEEERLRYRAVYCGLCRRLGELYRGRGRLTLSYDLTLLVLVISDALALPYEEAERRCAPHPKKPHPELTNACTDYAADMSVLLTYYKLLDDEADEGGALSGLRAGAFRSAAESAAERRPAVAEAVRAALSTLSEAERRNEQNPDVPAACFGSLLGAVFAGFSDERREELFAFGVSLGRVLYLMDACVDIQADLKRERYNPLIRTDFASAEALLKLELAGCVKEYRALQPQTDRGIVENVLLSGVWTAYDAHKRKEAERHDQ